MYFKRKPPHLLIGVVKSQRQHHVPHLQFQLIVVGGSVIVDRLHLEIKYSQQLMEHELLLPAGETSRR